MADEEHNVMEPLIALCDKELADKPHLASIHDEPWRLQTRSKLLSLGRVAYLGNAFGYQAPLSEESGLLPKGWQARLEEGASVLLPKLGNRERGHLIKRMRDTESASAEEELLLARGFAGEFGDGAITVPSRSDKAQPEFEVDAASMKASTPE